MTSFVSFPSEYHFSNIIRAHPFAFNVHTLGGETMIPSFILKLKNAYQQEWLNLNKFLHT